MADDAVCRDKYVSHSAVCWLWSFSSAMKEFRVKPLSKCLIVVPMKVYSQSGRVRRPRGGKCRDWVGGKVSGLSYFLYLHWLWS